MANPNPSRALTEDALAFEFTAAGVRAGEHLILHSSLRSLGEVEGGACTVIAAARRALGESGHLLTPAFTYSLPMWSTQPFEPRTSPSRVGAITEAHRHWPGALRSFHPTHSVVVSGPEADAIVRNHLHASPIGAGSPFHRMWERSARILMLGTRQDTNSSLHYCEVHAQVAYRHVAFTPRETGELAWFVNESGQIEYVRIEEVPGCSRGFRRCEHLLRERGVLEDVRVGPADCQLLDLRQLVAAMDDILKESPAILLCRDPACAICPRRRRHLAALGHVRADESAEPDGWDV